MGWMSERLCRAGPGILMAAGLFLSACIDTMHPEFSIRTARDYEEQTPLVMVPLQQAWVNPEGLKLVLQRGLLNSSEQRLLLVNRTTAPGDNFMLLRTDIAFGYAGRLRYEEFLRQAGGAPILFTDLEPGEMIGGEDALGAYFWGERRFGADTICVLAIRRLGNQARQLPRDVDAMDILLRNCVRGTAQQALAPILASSVGGGPGGAPTPGSTHMLSALAGPTPP